MIMINISELFGCGKSTMVRTIRKFIHAMQIQCSNVVLWPTDSIALKHVKEGFCEKRGFPNYCGAIDITHMILFPPDESSFDWYDRDHNHSMVL
eukprot:Gb_40579 [translate_table: standard]